jgi:hypothetical protein
VNREELTHIIRAACDLLGEEVVIVGGSQAAIAQFPDDLPRIVVLSREADIAALDYPTEEKAWMINGNIGEDTLFHTTNGIFAEGVGRELFLFPCGWEARAITLDGQGATKASGLCPEIHDLAVAKLAGGRQKDVNWIKALLQSGHIKPALLLERCSQSTLAPDRRELAIGLIEQAGRPGKRGRRELRHLTEVLRGEGTGEVGT